MRLSLIILFLFNFNLLADEAEIIRNIPIIGKVLQDCDTPREPYNYKAYEAQQIRLEEDRKAIRLNKQESARILQDSVKYYSYNDTDRDGYLDITEVKQGTSPTDPMSRPFGSQELLNNFYKNK